MKKKILSVVISLTLICCMALQPLTVGAGIYTISQINVTYEGMSATSDFASTYISGMGAGYLSSDSRVKITTSSSLVPSGSGSALCVNKCDMRWWTVEAQDQNITFSVDIKIDAAFANVFTPQVISKIPSFTGNGLTTLDLFTVKRSGSSVYLYDSNGTSLKKLSEGSTYSIVCNMTRGSNTYSLLCNGSTVTSSAPLADEIYSIDSLYINVAQGTLTSQQSRRGYTTDTVYIVLDNITVQTSGRDTPFQYSTQASGTIPTVNVPTPDYSDVRVFLNTEELDMYVAPTVTDGVLFLDMLTITTKLGMKYTLYTDGSFVIRGTNIIVQGNCSGNYITVNGETVALSSSPVKIDGRIHVTPDFINAVTHGKVWWDEADNMFVISTGKYMNDGILRTIGTKLFMNGEPYYEISFNKFDLFYQVMAGYVYNHEFPTEGVQYAAAEEALKRLNETGFKSIRVFMHSQSYLDLMYNEEHQEIYFQAMDDVFDLCDKYDIKVNVCLGLAEEHLLACDYVEGEGWVQGTETVYEMISDADSESRQNVYKYIEMVVGRYKDRDTVLMWEVNNELSLEADIGAAVGKLRFSLLELANFYTDVAEKIRSIDTERMVTSGDSAFRPAQWHLFCAAMNGADLDWTIDTLWDHLMALTLVNENLDLICMHAYGINMGITDEYTYATDDGTPVVMNWQLYKDECARLGKPFYCGETSPLVTPEADENYYTKAQAYLDEIVDTGVQLTHWWTFRSDRVGFDDGYTWVIDGGNLHDMIIDANQRLKETYCVNASEADNIHKTPETYVSDSVGVGVVTGSSIVNANSGATVSDIMNVLYGADASSVTIYTTDGTEVALGSVLSTGMMVTIDENTYTIIVAGDTSCDGLVNVTDVTQVLSYIRGEEALDGNALDAATSLQEDSSINILTATSILNSIL